MKTTDTLTLLLAVLLFFQIPDTSAQQSFKIGLEEVTFSNLPALQSFAWAADGQGRYLLIGGRTDGLHRRQPFASFDEPGKNDSLYVIDPRSAEVWSASLNGLHPALAEQFSASNFEFSMRGHVLYLVGGYGYSPTFDEHITYPYLSAIDVDKVTQAIIDGRPFSQYLRFVPHSGMAVTGGYMHRIGDKFYLIGGQNFEGRYNPMGADHGPGFRQQYSNEIRSFEITDDGELLHISDVDVMRDTLAFHRRDLNVLPQIFPDGQRGCTVFSGVFRYGEDLPWTTAVDIYQGSYKECTDFNQRLSHYHSAWLAIYDPATKQMHNLFFGGIARYTYNTSLGVLMDDPDVPFVPTISVVQRDNDNKLTEYALDLQMPGLLGANMAVLELPDAPFDEYGLLDLSEIEKSGQVVAYLFGGIESSAPNIFWTSEGELSKASNRLFKVSIFPVD